MTDRPTIARAALIARQSLPAAVEALTEAARWLDEHGCTPVVEAASAAAAGLSRWTIVSRESLASSADVVIAFGGDGTLLDAARAVAHSTGDAPVMGVNLGRLGFLTAVGRDDLTLGLDALLAGRLRIDERLLLTGSIVQQGTRLPPRLALNDIVITRGALSRMIELQVRVNDEVVTDVKADGLIVATATGSTAYNLSAGGPILHPAVDAVVLTPIAPHTLTNRPIVLPASSRITLHPLAEAREDLVATFDGQFGVPLGPGDTVAVTRAARVLRLLQLETRSHFDTLREKLKWGNG